MWRSWVASSTWCRTCAAQRKSAGKGCSTPGNWVLTKPGGGGGGTPYTTCRAGPSSGRAYVGMVLLKMFLRSLCVPFVNRPFESEIHGTVNFTQFCCVLLVTWCYRVLLACYLRPK